MILSRVLVLAGLAAIGLLLGELAVRAIEHRLLYHPLREIRATPGDLGLPYQDVTIPTIDGERLHAFWIPASGPNVILYCHGNGGNVSDWVDKMAVFARAGVSVLLFDYRGFGRSTGVPGDTGLFRDVEAAYRYLLESRGVAPERLVVWGNSLGGAVASHLLAGGVPARALIVESSPTSTREMSALVLPWLPGAPLLSRARFDTLRYVIDCHLPTLVIHGDADAVVPLEMGRRIWDAAPGPKRFFAVHDAGHVDGWIVGGPGYRDTVLHFIEDPRRPSGGDETQASPADHAEARAAHAAH